MDDEEHLCHLLGRAAALEAEPVPDVGGLVRRGQRARRVRRAQRVGGVALVALLIGVTVAAADSGTPDRDVATVDSPTPRDERIPPAPDRPGVVEAPATSTTTTTSTDEDAGDEGGTTTTSTTAPADPGPLRLIVAPSTLMPYELLSARPEDPCPPGSRFVDVLVLAIGGTMDGQIVGGGPEPVGSDGSWSTTFGLAAVGGIENVAWAMTAPELEVRAACRARPTQQTATYAPVRLRHGRVTVVPRLIATWDGQAATVALSGCPIAGDALLTWGDAPPPPGQAFGEPYVSSRMSPGSDPDSWVATVELPGYDPADGLWASALCRESSGTTAIWRSLPYELDPPG